MNKTDTRHLAALEEMLREELEQAIADSNDPPEVTAAQFFVDKFRLLLMYRRS